jgi:acyl carrier protein
MKIEKDLFFLQLQKLIEIDTILFSDSKLSELDNIDSLTYMSISAWLSDKFDVKISPQDIEKMSTIQELFNTLK